MAAVYHEGKTLKNLQGKTSEYHVSLSLEDHQKKLVELKTCLYHYQIFPYQHLCQQILHSNLELHIFPNHTEIPVGTNCKSSQINSFNFRLLFIHKFPLQKQDRFRWLNFHSPQHNPENMLQPLHYRGGKLASRIT
ncbi:hypothetical protein Tsubulata_029970 [Turnera subulata]|uniref:Uncharacterized protein n=1 Tax=Turnera subulata TaxID=218843 RepID=A0A9Q0FX55_9ROSI|nr:hypothetical protein Tsubulata_029970 [Turnera subulata]